MGEIKPTEEDYLLLRASNLKESINENNKYLFKTFNNGNNIITDINEYNNKVIMNKNLKYEFDKLIHELDYKFNIKL